MKIDLTFVAKPKIRARMEEQQGAQHLMPGPLSIAEYENAVIVPGGCADVGGLYDCQRKFVPLSWLSAWRDWGGYSFDGKAVCKTEAVLFLGTIFPTWGHCLTDFLSRVWPLLGELKAQDELSIAYVMTSLHEEMPEGFFALLKALGVEQSRIRRITEPTRFSKVYFPDRSFWHSHAFELDEVRHYSSEFVRTINAIRDFYAPVGMEKSRVVYLSRGGWKKGRADFGEDLIEKAFADHYGCEVIRPEHLTVREMVELLYQCKAVITTDGSIAHNSILGPNQAKWIIVRKSDFVNFHQPIINEIRDLDVTYVDAYGCSLFKKTSSWAGPFFMYVSLELARLLKCKSHFPIGVYFRFERCVVGMWLHGMASSFKRKVIKTVGGGS